MKPSKPHNNELNLERIKTPKPITEDTNQFYRRTRADFTGENEDCILEGNESEGGGRIISATLPSTLKGKLEFSYTPYMPTKNLIILIKPGAHSRDGFQSLIGKHTFKFRIRRFARYNCEHQAIDYSESNLTIDLEFTDPET